VPPDVRDDLPLYSIGRVVELTGLSARQVRYYEKKQLLSPSRTAGNQRLYTRDEVQLLQLVRRLRDEGYTLAHIQRLVRGHGREGEPRLEDYPSPEPLRREERASLYPLVNRARLLEILDRLEQRQGARRPPPGPRG
jgi:MerR family glutamine synthetase transcriptional repressor